MTYMIPTSTTTWKLVNPACFKSPSISIADLSLPLGQWSCIMESVRNTICLTLGTEASSGVSVGMIWSRRINFPPFDNAVQQFLRILMQSSSFQSCNIAYTCHSNTCKGWVELIVYHFMGQKLATIQHDWLYMENTPPMVGYWTPIMSTV